MKGKTGKPSAMRGGGLARKGVGMALKGGGMARKGTGSNATPGGKKMAMGGNPGMMPRPMGTKGADMDRRPLPGMSGPMTRPGFPSRPTSGGPVAIDPRRPSTPKPTGGVKMPGMARPKMGPENILVKPAPGSMMKKHGGKIKGKKNGK